MGTPGKGDKSAIQKQIALLILQIMASCLLVLKVWSTVNIHGTRVPQKAIVPVGVGQSPIP